MSDNPLSSIPLAFNVVDGAVRYVKYSMIVSIGLFLLGIPFYYANSSFFGLSSARRVIGLIRFCIFIECCLILPLIYCVVSLGSPLSLHAYTVYNSKGDSWIYGWGRPVLGFVVIGVGVIGDMNMYPRILCILGCIHQIVMDGLSEFQVHKYYTQIMHKDAPTGLYTTELIRLYYWRDLFSISACFLIILYMCYFSSIVGWGSRQHIPYSRIAGGDLDRCEVMRQQRELRKRMQIRMAGGDEELNTKISYAL